LFVVSWKGCPMEKKPRLTPVWVVVAFCVSVMDPADVLIDCT